MNPHTIVPSNREFRLGHRPELDGLRGLAVLSVLVYHISPTSVLPGGFVGVDVFFVLSGFLITARLLEEHRESGSISLGRFYLRRTLRLLPALVVMLTVCCLFAAIKFKPSRAQEIYQSALVTLVNAANWDWIFSVRLDMFGHAWSLSLEEQFYFLWPLLLGMLLRVGGGWRRLALLLVMGIFGAATFRAVLWITEDPLARHAISTNLLTRADSLLAGCLLAVLAHHDRLSQCQASQGIYRWLTILASSLLVLVALFCQTGAAFLHLGGFTFIALASAVVIAALLREPIGSAPRWLCHPLLMWLGRISYGLYLWHFPMLTMAPKLMHGILPITRQVPWTNWVIAYAAALGMATISYYGLERPLLRRQWRLNRRWPCRCQTILRTSQGEHHERP